MQELLVADSFRVRQHPHSGVAEVRGAQLHLDRFRSSVAEVSAGAGIDEFLSDAAQRIADFGPGWPRLELWQAHANPVTTQQAELRLTLRPQPAPTTSIELRSVRGFNAAHPARKGPNIAAYAALNSQLQAEALLLDSSGFVREGATTSLLWWHEGKLHQAAEGGRVRSVTEQLILRIAAEMHAEAGSPGVQVQGKMSPESLLQCEVWAVNALHGIRVVSAIDGQQLQAPDPERLNQFMRALDHTWQPIIAIQQ